MSNEIPRSADQKGYGPDGNGLPDKGTSFYAI